MLKIKNTEKMGRGVFTTEIISKGTIIETAETIPFKNSDLNVGAKLNSYTFGINKRESLIALGIGSLFNHSTEPNVFVEIYKENKQYYLDYSALRDLEEGEELFIDYGYTPNV
jgi:SET domain-containing protein